MKKLWALLFVLLLLPASYSEQRPADRLETAQPPFEGSIVHQTQDPAETILYFPDYVDGGGWSVQLVLSNVDPAAAAEVRAEVYDPEGQPVVDLFDSELTFQVPALGSRVLRSSGTGAIRRGWIQVRAGTDSVSGLLTYRHAQSGIEVGVQPVELGPQFALFVEESPTVGAGVAVYKPEASTRLELRIRDEEGSDPLQGETVSWGDFHQAARTLPEWFAVEGIDPGFLGDFRGLLFLETGDESPFAPLGLRFGKGTSSLSAVPAIRTQSEAPQETNLVFPDYVDGGGWSVQLVLSNVDPAVAAEVRVEVYDPEGQPVLDLFDSDLTFELPALGSRVLRSTGSEALRRGWIQVEADAVTISGLLTYRHARSGVEVGVEPVRLGKQFALFVEESGTVGAGLALFKPDAESRIELRLRDEEGEDPLNGLFLLWKDFHQAALTLPEWFDVPGVDAEFLRDFRGLLFLRTEDESGFAPLGLRFGKGTSSLSAVPAIRIPDGAGIEGGQAPPPTVKLSASPTSIERGESATLTWSSTSAESTEITPDIGAVPTSGMRKVSPNVTTTYRITVRGTGGQTQRASATVTVVASQRDALTAFYQSTGGPDWFESRNWGTRRPLGEWHGVTVDDDGRVTELHLSANGLTGPIPPELGNLTSLTFLNLGFNGLTGPIPPELGNLTGLKQLFLYWNGLTGPIPSELGELTSLRELDLHSNDLTGPIPPKLSNLTSLRGLELHSNGLTGPIPPELGNLTSLTKLNLSSNDLTGPIPPELGNLTRLRDLDLHSNGLTGPIPPELGNLTSLRDLDLHSNGLTGSILPELGNLTSLRDLDLHSNGLTGPIPPELGNLTSLRDLTLSNSGLTGPIPPELGNLTSLTDLDLSGNSGLAGILPTELTGLGSLETLLAVGTDLCAPSDPAFQDWLEGIDRPRVATCVSDSAAFAYLVQTVQSREYPVPLVAGERALLRVFVTSRSPTTAVIPPVRARFYVDGTEIHVADIPARTASLPTEVYEGDLSRSSNAEIPGEIVRPGLEMVIEIDPEETLDPGLVTASRIPDTGRMAVNVREMPTLHLTVIPFLWSVDPHRGAVEAAEAMEADPEGHKLLWETRTLLPIKDLEVTAHAPVMTSTSPDEFYPLIDETKAIRAMEGGSGHYMGTISNPGRAGQAGQAERPGWVFISRLNPMTMAHELGHNLSLYHAPCGGPGGTDLGFPYPDGSTGAWGYDFRYGGALASPFRPDLMSYCFRAAWISDYHFSNALRFRLLDEGAQVASLIAQEAKSLLLWGGMDAQGHPFLNPSFVVDAPSKLPRGPGEHRITGRSGSGEELFSVGFAMPEVADGDGSSSFAFVLPVEPGWAVRLASITLSGPGGSVTLDSDTDIPLYILVDPSTRQVRGILRDLPQADASALVSQAGTDSLDVLFSRGIPDAAAWGQRRILDVKGIGGGQAPPPALMLSVAPGSIDLGENATLTWSSTNAESVEITPDLSTVPGAGSRIVSPRTTTTYQITVRGGDGQTRTASVTVRVVGSQQTARSQRDVLMALYKSTGGPDWYDSRNWGTSRPLREWHGITVDGGGRVTDLDLAGNDLTGRIPPEIGDLTRLSQLQLKHNGLTGRIPPEIGNLKLLVDLDLSSNGLVGPIPPELGDLTRLTRLYLHSNDLTGPIPPELGNLTSLTDLDLHSNGLTGPIPPELGNLTSLTDLQLEANYFTGPIPPELGNLTRLTDLRLDGNDLTGPIPAELGNLTRLTDLRLDGNDLTGPIPAELGNLTRLTELDLSGNSGLAGGLPTELTGLGGLETLLAVGTDLCAPSDPGFQDWLEGIHRLRVATCVSDSATFAYLVQAVQSREYPVPLVSGEKALLRVFVTSRSPTTSVIPPVRARFYVDGTEIYVADIPARAASLPTEVYEGDLSRSSNAEIPGEIVRPGLEMVVEIDPGETLDPGLVTASRIPDTGRMAVDVREMPVLHLTVIPFLWSVDPHRGAVEAAEAMEADPEGHELLWKSRTLLPIKDFEVTARDPVMTSTSPEEFGPLFDETEAIRAMEGGNGHYMGTISKPGFVKSSGRAIVGEPVFISRLHPTTIAHELGHTMGLYHAPCGGAGGLDPAFPSPDGSTGAWGYDFRHGGALASPYRPDLMSYCGPAGISDYHFANALRFRLFDEGPPQAASLIAQGEGPPRPASLIAREAKSLLLWGGMDAQGHPFLNPSFVVDAPSKLPRGPGEHRITGRSGSGEELFSVGFAMPEVADGDGSSSFAFVLPVEPGWAVRLASITLSGPGGSVTLDSDTDSPLYVLVDPSTRQVRGILRDLPQAAASALVHQAGTDSLDVLFSRGIPDAAAWGP